MKTMMMVMVMVMVMVMMAKVVIVMVITDHHHPPNCRHLLRHPPLHLTNVTASKTCHITLGQRNDNIHREFCCNIYCLSFLFYFKKIIRNGRPVTKSTAQDDNLFWNDPDCLDGPTSNKESVSFFKWYGSSGCVSCKEDDDCFRDSQKSTCNSQPLANDAFFLHWIQIIQFGLCLSEKWTF